MHIQVGAYTMTRTMQIIQPLVPHGRTCQRVQLCATSPGWKLAELQLNVPFQHQRIDMALLCREWPQCYGAGNIRRSILVLRATVEQQ